MSLRGDRVSRVREEEEEEFSSLHNRLSCTSVSGGHQFAWACINKDIICKSTIYFLLFPGLPCVESRLLIETVEEQRREASEETLGARAKPGSGFFFSLPVGSGSLLCGH